MNQTNRVLEVQRTTLCKVAIKELGNWNNFESFIYDFNNNVRLRLELYFKVQHLFLNHNEFIETIINSGGKLWI